jgi:hypothetical protein
MFNHGGYYAPGNPRECNTPGGPCTVCQSRIDDEETAKQLLSLRSPRPPFLEPCPSCGIKTSYVSHASLGLRTCNGCDDKFCTKCYHGSRYCCAYVYGPLKAAESLVRQETLGVQSPKAEEKTENK